MSALLHQALARVRAFLRPGDLAREFDQELASHLAMAEEDKVRRGMTREQARRAARLELGGLTQLREAGREARGLPWLDTFWLDVKLGFRMLRKSWGLTLVGGLAMTIAILLGVAVFLFFEMASGGRLPLEDGERVVAIQTWDEKAHRRRETSMQDLERWHDGLGSLVEIGAFRNVERNLSLGGGAAGRGPEGAAAPVPVAEISASGFRLARAAPLLGRTLVRDDEKEGAAPVVVIGYEVWKSRFSADPAAVGRTVRLGDTVHTVVGVMPEGFAFPVNHRFWTPLRAAWTDSLPAAPEAAAFARLAPGATLERAQAELTTLGLLPTSGVPRADEELQVRVVPYTFAFTGDFDRGQIRWIVRIALILVTLLLVPPCANIAILVYARTITRQEEFAARYALGASRGRIVGQLFLELLVLAAAAAGVALLVARLALRRLETSAEQNLDGGAPFWMDFGLSFEALLFAAGLAVVAALIAGLVPALKATGRQMRSGLHTLGSRTGMQLGATWTALVVAQVALTVAALPAVVEIGWGTIRKGVLGPGFAAEDYLTARVEVDRQTRQADRPSDRIESLQAELVRQLKAEPGVLGVTLAELPGDEPWRTIEFDRAPLPGSDPLPSRSLVRINPVDEAFFEVFDIPLLAGRGFGSGDFEAGPSVGIVNQTFVQQHLGAGNPLGLRLRRSLPEDARAGAPESRPWVEIVGVVADRPAHATRGTVYVPQQPGSMHPAGLALRLASDPTGMADRLREIAAALDPTLRLSEVATLAEIYREKQVGNNVGAFSLAVLTLSVLLLSAAGMYALMSFTVNQRRREIGIRSALGAQPRRLLAGIFRRAVAQLAAGALGGILVALLVGRYLPAEQLGGWKVPGVVPAATALMVLVGLLATAGPARRGLRVDPIEELRQG